MPDANRSSPTISESLSEYGRGIAGGLLFSLPVMYTMEMWWTGFMATPLRLLTGLGATLLLLLLYNRYAGLRASASWREVAIDSVEELGIGLLLSLGLLWMVGRLGADTALGEAMGKVIIEGMAAAIGVSVGTAQLGGDDTQHDEEAQGMEGDRDDEQPSFFSTLALGLCGAFLVASNVAPTDEIMQIAAETPFPRLVGLALLSLGLGGLILYFSEFRGTTSPGEHERFAPLRDIITTYAVALLTAAFLLWFFDRFGGATLLAMCAQTVVLGLPAVLGASAGRLLLRGAS